jgi:hypothetical protein
VVWRTASLHLSESKEDGHGNVRNQKEEHSSGQEGQMAKHRAGHEPIMVALLGLMETVQVGLAPP